VTLPVAAQAQVATPRGEGIPFSRFFIFPSVSMEYQFEDNLLYQSVEDPNALIVETGTTLIRPAILMEMPFGTSRVRWSYAPLIRRYSEESVQGAEGTGDSFDLEGIFREGQTVSLAIKDHYVKDTVEVGQATGSAEFFGLVPFTVHAPEVQLSLQMGARYALSVIGRTEDVEFHESVPGGFDDYDRRGLEVRFNRRIAAPTILYGYAAHEDTVQHRDGSTVDSVDVIDRRVGVGLTRTVNQVVTTRMVAGYQTLDFEGGAGKTNYSGPVVSASGSLRIGDGSVLDLGVLRQPYQSFFFNNNFYVNDEVDIRWLRQIGRGFLVSLSATYGTSDYSDALDLSGSPGDDQDQSGCADQFESFCLSNGDVRRDHYFRMEVAAAYQFAPRLRVAVGYNHERRHSNLLQETEGGPIIDPFHYEVDRIFMRVEAGWL
jgi:hypothetical protein